MDWDRHNFLSFLAIICSFISRKAWKIKILKKRRKHLEMSSLYTCVPKNHNHMMDVSWNMECDRHIFLSCWAIFCPFSSLLTPKIKIWKKLEKNPGDIILLHMSNINEDHMMYASWDTRHGRQSFLSFWAMFCPLTLLTTCKINIMKNEKNTWRYYHHFTLVSHKWWSYVLWFLRYGAGQTEFYVMLCHFLPF